jgi:phytoene synthase
MVNDSFISEEQAAAERRIVLSYAPPGSRAGLAALLALDDTLAAIVRSTREPMVGRMRLKWWHDALIALDDRPAPAEPVLRMLAREVVPQVTGATLAELVEGWAALLDPDPLDDGRMARFAEGRGAGLFAAAGAALGAAPGDPLAQAGRGWALADLAAHVRDGGARARAEAMATDDLVLATAQRWSRPARSLGAMAHLARMQADAGAARVGRVLWHRLTGR